ncbi:protein LTV1 homolog [Montipora foliosa]|uniref:protein LTV1 homolog n=1 Tax=Montipora foliosa TaxID=591990 RepID=UPI0035F11CC1
MGKKKKPFIDKKKAHTFHLVHRSQKDPLQADDESSKHVLVPLNSGQQDSSANDSLTIKHRRKEEEKKCGIFFDDDYDYLQHIKPRTNPTLEPLPENVSFLETKEHIQFGNVQLPTEVFASRYEEPEGLLNLAAPTYGPRPDLDPDIVAALDDALDLDDPKNILEDDFVLKANEEDGDYESEDDLIRSDDEDDHFFPSDEASDSEADDEFSHFEEEETKSRFTNYSLTSSVLRRNEGLKLIDERFEKLMEEYDEDEIGALDHEELEGTMNPDSERLHALAEEFIERQQNQNSAEINESESSVMHNTDGVVDEDNKDDSSDSLDEFIRIKEEPKEKWDCESILSTYSNLYNHPTLIKDPPKVKPIKLSKAGIPLGVFSHGGVSRTLKGGEGEDVEDAKTEQTCMAHNSIRSKDETKEEKKLRKQDVKSDRKVRRMEKKANKIAFKSEKQKQEFSLMHTKQQQGKKL